MGKIYRVSSPMVQLVTNSSSERSKKAGRPHWISWGQKLHLGQVRSAGDYHRMDVHEGASKTPWAFKIRIAYPDEMPGFLMALDLVEVPAEWIWSSFSQRYVRGAEYFRIVTQGDIETGRKSLDEKKDKDAEAGKGEVIIRDLAQPLVRLLIGRNHKGEFFHHDEAVALFDKRQVIYEGVSLAFEVEVFPDFDITTVAGVKRYDEATHEETAEDEEKIAWKVGALAPKNSATFHINYVPILRPMFDHSLPWTDTVYAEGNHWDIGVNLLAQPLPRKYASTTTYPVEYTRPGKKHHDRFDELAKASKSSQLRTNEFTKSSFRSITRRLLVKFCTRYRRRVQGHWTTWAADYEALRDRYVFCIQITPQLRYAQTDKLKGVTYQRWRAQLLKCRMRDVREFSKRKGSKYSLGIPAEFSFTTQTTSNWNEALKSLRGESAQRLSPGAIKKVRFDPTATDGFEEADMGYGDWEIQFGQEMGWIKDLEVTLTDLASNKNIAVHRREIHSYTHYWLLPMDFQPYERTTIRLSEIDKDPNHHRLLGGRYPPSAKMKAAQPLSSESRCVFPIESPEEAYVLEMRTLLKHLDMMTAWKTELQRWVGFYDDELKAHTRIIQPVVQALQGMRFTGKGIVPGSTREMEYTFEDLKEEKFHEGIEDTLITQREIAERQRYHYQRALKILSKDTFSRVFRNAAEDVAAKNGAQIHQEYDTDALPGRRYGPTVVIPSRVYTVNDSLKLSIVTSLLWHFPTLCPSPKKGKRPSRHEQELAVRNRQAMFEDTVGRYIRALVAGQIGAMRKAEGDKKAVDSVLFLNSALGKSTFWDVMGGGGFTLLLYGRSGSRNLFYELMHLAQGEGIASVVDLQSQHLLGKKFWQYSAEEWDEFSSKVQERGGFKSLGGFTLFVSWAKLIFHDYGKVWAKLQSGGFKDASTGIATILETSEVVLTTFDLALKTTQLAKPVWFQPLAGGELASGAKALKVLGNALAVVGILKDAVTIYSEVGWAMAGYTLDTEKVVMAGLGISAGIVALCCPPPFGMIAGGVVLLVQLGFKVFTVPDLEILTIWYCRTPWGKLPHEDEDTYEESHGKLGYESKTERYQLLLHALAGVNGFLKAYLGALPKKGDREKIYKACKAYFISWANSALIADQEVIGRKDRGVKSVSEKHDDYKRLELGLYRRDAAGNLHGDNILSDETQDD